MFGVAIALYLTPTAIMSACILSMAKDAERLGVEYRSDRVRRDLIKSLLWGPIAGWSLVRGEKFLDKDRGNEQSDRETDY